MKNKIKRVGRYLVKKLSSWGSGLSEDIKTRICGIRERKLYTCLTLLGCVAVIIGLAAGIVYEKGHGYFQRSNYVEDTVVLTQEAAEDLTETEQQAETDPELLEIQQNIEKYSESEPITTDGSVYNILLVGVDKTKRTDKGNSDSMILISLNYEREEINMISLMRDTYVQIPGIGYRKLNAAYANGGGPLLVETVTENFKIQVDRYMAVSFRDMANIIDAIGGITIIFTEKEAENANQTITSMCRTLKLDDQLDEYLIPGSGSYECNGIQAVAYSRIRKVGNSDYQRTQRQREVLTKMFNKVKKLSIDDIDRLANELLPEITHNIPESEFWGLLGKAPAVLKYELVKDRIPYDGMYSSKGEYLVPDWEETVEKLKRSLYTWRQTAEITQAQEHEE